jgi:GNAT superfamily N-acetyltransferase
MTEVRVHRAGVDDADAIGRVHVASWRVAYRGLLPDEVLEGLDPAARSGQWREILARPPAGTAIFAAVAPVSDVPGAVAVAATRTVAAVAAVAAGPAVAGETVGANAATIVGFACAAEYSPPEKPDNAGEVRAIYVHPGHWGTGAGWALMDAAVAHLTAAGPRPVRLWALDGNERADRFYRRYGYGADGAVGTYLAGAATMPTVRYTLHPR